MKPRPPSTRKVTKKRIFATVAILTCCSSFLLPVHVLPVPSEAARMRLGFVLTTDQRDLSVPLEITDQNRIRAILSIMERHRYGWLEHPYFMPSDFPRYDADVTVYSKGQDLKFGILDNTLVSDCGHPGHQYYQFASHQDRLALWKLFALRERTIYGLTSER